MEKTEPEKKLSSKQIRIMQILLLTVGVLFLLIYFLFIFKSGNQSTPTGETKNKSVYYKDQRLHIGSEVLLFKNSADTFSIHGDYLLIIQPFTQTTHIYSLKEQKKIKDIKQVVLDFDGKNELFNKNGIQTFFNGKDLQTTCFGGFIKSPTEILCITPKKDDNLDNKLISINPQTLKKTDVYSSAYTLNYVTVIDDKLFIGGYNLQSKENVLIVNTKPVQVPNRIAVAYKKTNKIYAASLQDNENNTINSYYLIKIEGLDMKAHLESEKKIILF